MDKSPYRFETPWHAFEMAFHIVEVKANLVVVSMAWPTNEDGSIFTQCPQEPDMDTLMYWVSRLEPVIRSDCREETIVVFANRTGFEGESIYAGTSAVLGILEGEVRVYGLLGRCDKELLIVDTDSPPYGKLVYRPEGEDLKKNSRPTYFSDDNLSISSSAAAWIPLPASPVKQNSVAITNSGSPRADSETCGFENPTVRNPVEISSEPSKAEPIKPAVQKPQLPKVGNPAAGKRALPKLSLQTGADVLKGCGCNVSAWSTSSLFDSQSDSNPSGTRVLNPAEAMLARRQVDAKVHRATPHPFHRRQSPARLFKKATAALKRGTMGSPAMYCGSDSLHTPSSRRGDMTAVTVDSTWSNFGGSEGDTLASARSRRNSFDGHVLSIYTPGGGNRPHTGSNVGSPLRSRQPAVSFNNIRTIIGPEKIPEESGSHSPMPRSPGDALYRSRDRFDSGPPQRSIKSIGQDTDLSALAKKLQEIANNVAAAASKISSAAVQPPVIDTPRRNESCSRRGDGRGNSLVDDRRRTPSAEPSRRYQGRSESRNGLQDLAVAQAGSTSRSASHVRCDSCSRQDKRHESRQRGVPTSATRAWAYAHEVPSSAHQRAQSRGRQRARWSSENDASASHQSADSGFSARIRSISRQKKKAEETAQDESQIKLEATAPKRSSSTKRACAGDITARALEAARIIDEKRARRSLSLSRSAARTEEASQFNSIKELRDPNYPRQGERCPSQTRDKNHSRRRSDSIVSERRQTRDSQQQEAATRLNSAAAGLKGLSKSLSNTLHRSMSVTHLRQSDMPMPSSGQTLSSRRDSVSSVVGENAQIQGPYRIRGRSTSLTSKDRQGPIMAPTPPEESILSRIRQRSEMGRHQTWVDSWMPPPLHKLGLGIDLSMKGTHVVGPLTPESPTGNHR